MKSLAPAEASAEFCGGTAPFTVKLAPGSDWKTAPSAGLLTQSCAQATRLCQTTGMAPTICAASKRAPSSLRVEGGASRREAAEHYEVSPSTAVIWMKCFRETGRCAAKLRGGSVSPLEDHTVFLLALIDKQPDLTLDEVVAAMRRNKVAGSRTAVWRFFQRHRITLKKSVARRGAGARRRGAGTAALDARARHV